MYALIILHFLSDWILQPRAVAKRKTTNIMWLLKHLIVIHCTFALFSFVVGIPQWVCLINTVAHGLIDKTVWKLFSLTRGPFNEEYLKYNKHAEDYWFYFTIAVDQTLHICLLIFLFGEYV